MIEAQITLKHDSAPLNNAGKLTSTFSPFNIEFSRKSDLLHWPYSVVRLLDNCILYYTLHAFLPIVATAVQLLNELNNVFY